MAESDLFSDLLGSQSSGFMQKFRYGGSFKPRTKTEGDTTTTTFEPDNDPPASFQQPSDLKEGEVYANTFPNLKEDFSDFVGAVPKSTATPTETPRFAGTAFNVDLRDYAPSFKVTRAAKGSRGGAIGGGRPMDTQEVSVAPIQKPDQFTFSQTIQEREQPNYSSQLDDLKKQLEALNAKKPEPAPTPPPPPAPEPPPAPAPQPDNSWKAYWNQTVAQQGKWHLWQY